LLFTLVSLLLNQAFNPGHFKESRLFLLNQLYHRHQPDEEVGDDDVAAICFVQYFVLAACVDFMGN